jgi:FixJ family two-component response regulator
MLPVGTVQGDGMGAIPHGGRQVVVVDSDAAVRDSLTFLLEAAGYKVVAYASGPECLAAINLDTTLCLVVDQLMPRMTGLEFLAALQRQGARLPTALMVEAPMTDLTKRATEQGITCVLPKLTVQGDLLRFVADAAEGLHNDTRPS